MILDVALVLALLLSIVAGLRVGLLVRAAGFGGLVVGIVLSTAIVPVVVELVGPRTPQGVLVATSLTIAMTVLVSMVVFQLGAFRFRGRIDEETTLRAVDRVGGAAAGVVTVLVFVWVTTPVAVLVPGAVSAQVRASVVVELVDGLSPAAPDTLLALESFVGSSRFPEVFSDIAPARTDVAPPTAVAVPPLVIASGTASSVEVEAAGCGRLSSGSGWTVEPELVVTNAHVVVGADTVLLRRSDGARIEADVVVLDARRDLALLHAPGLGLVALPRATAVDREAAASFGHPLGQDEVRVAPVVVDRTVLATGRDVYGEERVERAVVVLAAALQVGDSGSAVMDADGSVIATVFAINPMDPSTAYALADEEVTALLAAPRVAGASGRCP